MHIFLAQHIRIVCVVLHRVTMYSTVPNTVLWEIIHLKIWYSHQLTPPQAADKTTFLNPTITMSFPTTRTRFADITHTQMGAWNTNEDKNNYHTHQIIYESN